MFRLRKHPIFFMSFIFDQDMTTKVKQLNHIYSQKFEFIHRTSEDKTAKESRLTLFKPITVPGHQSCKT